MTWEWTEPRLMLLVIAVAGAIGFYAGRMW